MSANRNRWNLHLVDKKSRFNLLEHTVFFVIANEAHLSSLITMPNQLHHATKMSRRGGASLVLFDRIKTSSANWSHAHSFVECFGPQIYPRLTRFDFLRVRINVMKHKLNRSGKHGSPCKTPFLMPIGSV